MPAYRWPGSWLLFGELEEQQRRPRPDVVGSGYAFAYDRDTRTELEHLFSGDGNGGSRRPERDRLLAMRRAAYDHEAIDAFLGDWAGRLAEPDEGGAWRCPS